jgi:hypothetical protein
MIASRRAKHLSVIASAAVLAAAIAAPLAGTDAGPSPTTTTARSLPNGKTDVIKAMGNAKWMADVKPAAAQFRGRYQLRLDQAQKLIT